MISDDVLAAENKISTVTVTPHLSQTPHSTSPLESHCGPPFSLMAWRGLTSIVHKPRRWQVASSTPLKTTKMLLRFCRPMTTVMKSRTSSLKVLDSSNSSLLKGWVYEPEEVRTGVKAKVVDPAQYQMLDAPLMRSKHKALAPPDNHHLQSPLASNTIKAWHSFPSASAMSTVVKHWRVTSALILTPPTLL
jgi:hypothetical protein